jgi:hypothetical protein
LRASDRDVAYRAIVIRNGSMTNLGVVLASHQAEVREMRTSAAQWPSQRIDRASLAESASPMAYDGG